MDFSWKSTILHAIYTRVSAAMPVACTVSTGHHWMKTCENAVKNLWNTLWKDMWTVQFHMFFHVFHTFFTGCESVETLWKWQFSQGQNPCKTLWKPCEKTCELSQCFSQGRKCQNLWKGQFSQGQNPCKTLWKTLWVFTLWKNLWKTCELSQCFSQGRKFQNLWKGQFSQGQNLCKTLWKTMWVFNLWKNLWKTLWKTSELSQCFSWGWKSQTCEQGIFHRVRTCEKPSEMGGVYLVAVCCQRCPPPPQWWSLIFVPNSQGTWAYAFKLY